jgi:inorganic pyrophosphatase
MSTNNTFFVTIEIPKGSRVKYEYDEETNEILVDRILPSSYVYPANYGFIKDTLAEDGDPLDILVLSNESFIPGCKIKCRPVGVLYTKDGKSMDKLKSDPKVIAVPDTKIDKHFSHVEDIEDVPLPTKEIIEDFFENYKNNQDNAYVITSGWGNKEDAEKIYIESINLFKKEN